MTQDEIIAMAREAGFIESNAHSDIIVRHSNGSWVSVHDILERFHALAVAAEREACAKLCDEQAARSEASMLKAKYAKTRDIYSAAVQTAHWNAAAIRARGNHASS